MPKPSIIAVENGVTITNPDAATLSRWAVLAHTEKCVTCRRGQTWCSLGMRLQAVTTPHDDIPGYPEI